MEETLFYYVRDASSRVAHHWDYERDRPTHALCGHRYVEHIAYEGEQRPSRVCALCQRLTPAREIRWWRAKVSDLETELTEDQAYLRRLLDEYDRLDQRAKELQAENRALRTKVNRLEQRIRQTQATASSGPKKRTASPSAPKKKPHRKPPPIRVVSGGAPGLGKRR